MDVSRSREERSRLGDNLLLLTDSYKLTHWRQYPPGTEKVYSYFESRGGMFDKVVFFGLQYFVERYLEGAVVTQDKIDEAAKIAALHLGNESLFNREGWEYILRKHGGMLPVSIKAVPEGSVVETHNVLVTVENTDPKCYWLTNYLETLLVQTWYPTTVATLSRNMKIRIMEYLDETGNPELIDFKLHDFGFRGVSSVESAGIGGAAHLVNFKGTDTIASLILLRDYYDAGMAGFSIPAAEHSTITAWGREHESDAMKNMLEQFPTGTVAVVSDSYNIYKACSDIWGDKLKEKVLGRNGMLVIRPDSGDPPEVVLKVLEILGDRFGYSRNEKGYKVLNDKVRVIQGDGMDYAMARDILDNLMIHKWSADNVSFGMGGALLQKLNRDTQKFAFKCSGVTVDGKERDVYKEPITDPGKNSKAGRLKLLRENGTYYTVKADNPGKDELVEVFRDGRLLRKYTLNEVRERAMLRNWLGSEHVK
jgi:nicotinamide phosphoribosyltransferase